MNTELKIEGSLAVASNNNDGTPYFNDFTEMVNWMTRGKNIDTDLSNIKALNDINRFFKIGRGGNHIWISDMANRRQAIIYYK